MTSNENSSSTPIAAVLEIPSKKSRMESESEESSSSSSSDMMVAATVHQHQIESDGATKTETRDNNEKEFDVNWRFQSGDNKPNIALLDLLHKPEISACTELHDFYFLFVTDEIFENIARQTNIYAAQQKSEMQSNRLDQWYDTDPNEIKRFFGLIIWMGLVRLPKIDLYWSTYEGYQQSIPRKTMPRNRFELLLRFVHFSDNADNRISKIINHLNNNFKKYNPEETVSLDECMVPCRGRMVYRQYIPPKHNRNGVKIFKLSSGSGYVYEIRIYTKKDENPNISEIVMSLRQVPKAQTIGLDKWNTSTDLAEKLIVVHKHLLGTRESSPKPPKKLKSDVAEGEDTKGKENPKMVVEYSLATSIDLTDQMVAYSSPLRKSIKWYTKIAIELLLNTCIANSLVLFKQVTGKSIAIPDFRMKLAMYLMKSSVIDCVPAVNTPPRLRHELKKTPGSARNNRRSCKVCYETMSKQLGRTAAKNYTKKVMTFCSDCVGSPFLCLECFNLTHRNMP